MIASRNSVLRYAAGGSSRGLNALRHARAKAKHDGNLGQFWKAVRRSIGGKSDPSRHVHPRHKREQR